MRAGIRFVELDKSFRFDRGQAVIFRPDLLHGVEPVTKGTRKVLISFLYDVEEDSQSMD